MAHARGGHNFLNDTAGLGVFDQGLPQGHRAHNAFAKYRNALFQVI